MERAEEDFEKVGSWAVYERSWVKDRSFEYSVDLQGEKVLQYEARGYLSDADSDTL